jgi:hypothetical protein
MAHPFLVFLPFEKCLFSPGHQKLGAQPSSLCPEESDKTDAVIIKIDIGPL